MSLNRLVFNDFEKVFDSIYNRLVTEFLTSQEIEKLHMTPLANIYKAAKVRSKICNGIVILINNNN